MIMNLNKSRVPEVIIRCQLCHRAPLKGSLTVLLYCGHFLQLYYSEVQLC